jgi:hypothetical protein
MNVGRVLLWGGVVVGALVLVVWLGQPGGSQSAETTGIRNKPKIQRPEIANKGPYPKAVVDELVFNFGAMSAGEEQSHEYVIRNEGEATLVIRLGKPSCKCTFGELEKNVIPPGDSAKIKVTWRPLTAAAVFLKINPVLTNDPNNEKIELITEGVVETLFAKDPPDEWVLGTIPREKPTELTALIHSTILDEIKILEFTSSCDELKVEPPVPLSKEELKRLGSKSGYRITAKLFPEMPEGHFMEKISLRVDMNGEKTITWFVQGNRPGHFHFVPTPGMRWAPKERIVRLGRFNAQKGKTAKLFLFVTGLGSEELKFLDIDSNSKDVKISLSPKLQGGRRYELKFEVPPGSPPANRMLENSAKVKIKTNHPQTSELKFTVEYISF